MSSSQFMPGDGGVVNLVAADTLSVIDGTWAVGTTGTITINQPGLAVDGQQMSLFFGGNTTFTFGVPVLGLTFNNVSALGSFAIAFSLATGNWYYTAG